MMLTPGAKYALIILAPLLILWLGMYLGTRLERKKVKRFWKDIGQTLKDLQAGE